MGLIRSEDIPDWIIIGSFVNPNEHLQRFGYRQKLVGILDCRLHGGQYDNNQLIENCK